MDTTGALLAKVLSAINEGKQVLVLVRELSEEPPPVMGIEYVIPDNYEQMLWEFLGWVNKPGTINPSEDEKVFVVGTSSWRR